MSVREEDRQKNCPSRGLGLAAAAIGVGVGAALYYFFSKSPEQPANEGSTSSNWSSEGPQALSEDTSSLDNSDTTSDEATDETSPENTTSDSSYRSTEESLSEEDTTANTYSDSLSTLSSNASGHNTTHGESNESFTSMDILSNLVLRNLTLSDDEWIPNDDSTLNRHETLHTPNSRVRRENESSELNGANAPRRNGSVLNILQAPFVDLDADTREWDLPEVTNEWSPSSSMLAGMYSMIYRQYLSGNQSQENESSELNGANAPRRNGSVLNILQAPSVDSDADTREWDVTTSSLGLPEVTNERSPSPSTLARMYRSMIYPQYLSGNQSRERPRTVEDCCICFEPMLPDQHLLGLACTHYFHAACIRPWLEEQNTCPNCRKNAIV